MASPRNTLAISIGAGLLAATATWATGSAQRTRLQRELATRDYEATHDQLTGLLNRRGLESLLVGAQRPCAVALLDLVRFKAINDTYGYDAGDLLLHTIATRLAGVLGHHRVARLGGDEFLAVLEHHDASGLIDEAARLRAHLGQPIRLTTETVSGREPYPGAATVVVPPRIGLVVMDRTATMPEALRAAAMAVFRAKQEGAAVYRFDPSHDAHLAVTTHSRPIRRLRDQRFTRRHLRALPTSA